MSQFIVIEGDHKDPNDFATLDKGTKTIYGPFDKEIDKQEVAISQNGENSATEKTGRTGALPYIGEAWYRNKFKLPEFNRSFRYHVRLN